MPDPSPSSTPQSRPDHPADAASLADRLRRSEQRNQALISALPDLLFCMSDEGVYLDCVANDPEALFVEPASFLGKRMHEVIPRQVADPAMDVIRRTLRTGRVELFEYELPIRGEMRHYEARFIAAAEHEVLAIVRDITERKRADCDLCRQKELLAESEKRYRLLAENASDIIAVFSPEGIRTYVSPSCRSLGFEPEDLIGRHGYEIVHPDDRARLKAAHLAVLESGRDENLTLRILRKDGGSVPMETTTRAVRDPGSGRIIEIQTHSRDVSERLAAQQRTAWLLEKLISAQEEERRHIARELHDDTGQSLTSLLVGLRTLEDVQSMEAAQSRARELRQLVTRTLEDVRRLASGLRPAVLDDLGLHAALDRFVRDFADAHRILVDLEAEPRDLAGLSPPMETAIFRIVQEALANVARHARASSARVLVDRPPGALEVIIEDDGQGFDAQAALCSDRAGRGMGLDSMRERASLLGGSLAIESAPGKGTAVALRLPLS